MYTLNEITFEDRDEYNRIKIAERILSMIQDSNNSPLFIDGAWGSGKSEFSHKLFHFLNESHTDEKPISNKPLIVSYINSFAGDYISNPFMLIVQAIYNALLPADSGEEEIRSIQNKITKGIRFFKKAITGSTKALNIKVPIIPEVVEIEANIGDMQASIQKEMKYSDDIFKNAFIEELEYFRSEAEELSDFKNGIKEAIGDKILVLIIDELDRCRPDYALELLENVKHIFDISNIFIIFSANKKQIESMICKRYGYNFEAERYLEKFYQKEIFLTSVIPPKDNINPGIDHRGHLEIFCKILNNQNEYHWTPVDFENISFIKDLLCSVETRQLEKIADNLNLYLKQTQTPLNKYSVENQSVIILTIFILVTNKELLRNIEDTKNQAELIKWLSNPLKISSNNIPILQEVIRNDFKKMSFTRSFGGYRDVSQIVKIANLML